MKEMGAEWSMDPLSPPSPLISLSPFLHLNQRARKASARAMKSCQENKILADSSTKNSQRVSVRVDQVIDMTELD
jgi:hypothetical protein